MVNRPLPYMVSRRFTAAVIANWRPNRTTGDATKSAWNGDETAFAQILGKLYFFELLENLRRILFDYAQKPSDRANAAFNAIC
jgi:hypothetical protein